MTLIALKREVAVEAKAFAGFPWSECQVVKTGDKSLYEYTDFTIHTEECTVTTCRATKTFIVRKGGGFFYGSKSGNENYIKSIRSSVNRCKRKKHY